MMIFFNTTLFLVYLTSVQNLKIHQIFFISEKLKGKNNPDGYREQIDVSNLPEGIYNVRVSNGEGVLNKKLVVVR